MATRIFIAALSAIGIGFMLSTPSDLLAEDATKAGAKNKDGIPYEWMPWVDPENPGVLVLDHDSSESWRKRRDTSRDPKREPGMVNPQRYDYGLNTHGFPTYFNLPMAFNSADLKASQVEIAFFGSALDAQYLQGAKFAANKMRTLTDVTFWPTAAGTDPYLRVNYFETLNMVDYGNASANIAHNQKTIEEITKVIGEIHDGGAIGISVGGTHAQMYAWIMALAKEHGAGNFAMFHVDAHYDAQAASNGIFSHNGAMIRLAVEQGLIKGEDVVSWGLRSPVPSADELQWMRDNRQRYYGVAQLEAEGYDAVAQKVFKDLKGKKLFVSLDMDGINPGEAPAVGSSAVGGPSISQAARMLRGLGMQNQIIGAEFGEYNPLLDDAHTTTGVAMERLMRSLIAGIAARKLGHTDPNYNAPEALDDGVE